MNENKNTRDFSFLDETFKIDLDSQENIVVALAGNPNTGKSTVFNSLTGLNQHTGNWPGKTVSGAQGKYIHEDEKYVLVDLPGTYSLLSNSQEEEIARDFICFGKPDVTVLVVDATCLERNLNLALQIIEITDKVVLCVNLMDEAKKKDIHIDLKKLENILGIPVVGTNARSGQGLDDLKDKIRRVSQYEVKLEPLQISYGKDIEKAIQMLSKPLEDLLSNKLNSRWLALRLMEEINSLISSIEKYLEFDLHENPNINQKLIIVKKDLLEKNLQLEDIKYVIVSSIIEKAEEISDKVVVFKDKSYHLRDEKIDDILTSRLFGMPIMIALLGLIF